MTGFIIGLIWLLVAIGNDKNFYLTTGSIHQFLWWWYLITSIIIFFTIPLAGDENVSEEIRVRFLKGAQMPKEQIVACVFASYVLSRILLFMGLSYLNQSAFIGEMVQNNKFTVGAILLFLGASMGVSATFPLMAHNLIQNKRVTSF